MRMTYSMTSFVVYYIIFFIGYEAKATGNVQMLVSVSNLLIKLTYLPKKILLSQFFFGSRRVNLRKM